MRRRRSVVGVCLVRITLIQFAIVFVLKPRERQPEISPAR